MMFYWDVDKNIVENQGLGRGLGKQDFRKNA